MIKDSVHLWINSSPDRVFDLLDKMPNKFPIYDILETRPIIFLRLMLVGGFKAAREAVQADLDITELRLEVGESIGFFTLMEKDKPTVYSFELKSLFFNCRTGYVLTEHKDGTSIDFDLIAENPTFREKVWWFFVKPVHRLFARKVLNVIKEQVEQS